MNRFIYLCHPHGRANFMMLCLGSHCQSVVVLGIHKALPYWNLRAFSSVELEYSSIISLSLFAPVYFLLWNFYSLEVILLKLILWISFLTMSPMVMMMMMISQTEILESALNLTDNETELRSKFFKIKEQNLLIILIVVVSSNSSISILPIYLLAWACWKIFL